MQATDERKAGAPPLIWLFLVLGVVGVVGGAALFGPVLWRSGQSYRIERETVEEVSGSQEEILARAKVYLRVPGDGYPYPESAELRAASAFPPMEQSANGGEISRGEWLGTNVFVIREAIESLEPDGRVTWMWENEQDPNFARAVDIVRWKDGTYQLTVTDIRKIPVEQD
jgi:hypothetical protein